jgi:hypothetical protein
VTRLLAEVTKIIDRKKRPAIGNFDCELLTLRVRIKGSAKKTLKIPAGTKGKHCTIKRTYPKDWAAKKGNLLILTEEETKQCLRKHTRPIRRRKWKSFVMEDANSDGFAEYSYANSFLKAVIAPHYGARLLQLWNRFDNTNALFGGGFYESKGYVEMGGIEETLNTKGRPDELWNARFKRVHCALDDVLSLSYKMKKAKGMSVQKQFTFYEALPLLLQTTCFSFKPAKRKKKKGKGKKEKKSIRPSHRIFFAIGGESNFSNLFHIPNENGMQTVRFNRPFYRRAWEEGNPWWEWQHCHFMPDPGFMILENENTKEVLMLFFDKQKLEFIWTGDRKGTPRLQITYKEKKLQPKKKASYHLLSAVAHGYAFSENGILIVSKGTSKGKPLPLSFIFYTGTKRKKATLIHSKKGQSEEEMTKHIIPGIPGSFFSKLVTVQKDVHEVRASIKGKPLEVRLSIE